jgi:SAM-dependent methyltransferase
MDEPGTSRHGSGFTASEYASTYADGMERSFWNRARNRVIERRVRRALAVAPGRVLDIGCGRGIVVDHLRRSGIDCIGAEISQAPPLNVDVAPYLRLGCDIGDLPAELTGAVRVALLADVLEHLPEPNAFLHRCRLTLPALRALVITLPARQELWSNYDEHYGHFQRHRLEDLPGLLAGLRVRSLETSYFFHGLYLPLLFLTLLGRKRNTEFQPPGGGIAGTIHQVMGSVFSLEDRLVPRRLPGTSLIALVLLD